MDRHVGISGFACGGDNVPPVRAIKSVFWLSVFTALHTFLSCNWIHWAMFDLYVINHRVGTESAEYKSLFMSFLLFEVPFTNETDEEKRFSGVSELFKILLGVSFLIPWLCCLYKKIRDIKVIFRVAILYCILIGGFMAVFIYQVIFILPDTIYWLHYGILALAYVFLSLSLYVQGLMTVSYSVLGKFRMSPMSTCGSFFFIYLWMTSLRFFMS